MIVSEATMQEAAFELLASSTAKRYRREAERLAAASGLADRLRTDPALRARASDRVRELLDHLRGDARRSPQEFEAALLLCALARTEGGMALLGAASQTPSAWVRALARWLLLLGPPSSEDLADLTAQIAPALTEHVVNDRPAQQSDREDRRGFPRIRTAA